MCRGVLSPRSVRKGTLRSYRALTSAQARKHDDKRAAPPPERESDPSSASRTFREEYVLQRRQRTRSLTPSLGLRATQYPHQAPPETAGPSHGNGPGYGTPPRTQATQTDPSATQA